MLETWKVDTQGAFRNLASIICNRYGLLRRMFRKWVQSGMCRSVYSL